MGITVDQTIPALFAPASGADDTIIPLAQLGAGPDGAAVLGRRGDHLVEVLELSFAVGSPRWADLEARIRAVGAIGYPGVRAALAVETDPPSVILEGDNSPPLAELIERSIDLRARRSDARALPGAGETARTVVGA